MQKMAVENRPTYNVANDKVLRATDTASYVSGHIGFGSWATAVEFKDFKLTAGGRRVDVQLRETTRNYGNWAIPTVFCLKPLWKPVPSIF